MTECLRFLRLGIINVLGVTVPGVLLIFFTLVGFLLPLAMCALPLCQGLTGSDKGVTWETTFAFWESNKALILSLTVVMAYVAGYVLRLSTPDGLDKISAEIVLRKMDAELKRTREEEARNGQAGDEGSRNNQILASVPEVGRGEAATLDHWPYRGERDNKYPYLHFKDYVTDRGLNECADLVVWGVQAETSAPQSGLPAPGSSKRSKTHVNMMKLEVMTESPELSAVVESNEAHVRLMFGTWRAVKACRLPVLCGAALSIAGLVMMGFHKTHGSPPYVTCLILCLALVSAMQWAKAQIENLFHYQRVR